MVTCNTVCITFWNVLFVIIRGAVDGAFQISMLVESDFTTFAKANLYIEG